MKPRYKNGDSKLYWSGASWFIDLSTSRRFEHPTCQQQCPSDCNEGWQDLALLGTEMASTSNLTVGCVEPSTTEPSSTPSNNASPPPCEWSTWEPIGNCSQTCGNGTQNFGRRKITEQNEGGCDNVYEKQERYCDIKVCKESPRSSAFTLRIGSAIRTIATLTGLCMLQTINSRMM